MLSCKDINDAMDSKYIISASYDSTPLLVIKKDNKYYGILSLVGELPTFSFSNEGKLTSLGAIQLSYRCNYFTVSRSLGVPYLIIRL